MIHWLDLILLLVLARYAVDGWRRGCMELTFELIGFALSIMLATLGYRSVGLVFDDLFPVPPSYVDAVAFLFIWWLADLAWPLVSRPAQEYLSERWRFRKKVNRALCVAPGVVNGVLISSVIVTAMLSFPVPAALKRDASVSIVALTMPEIIRGMDRLLKPALGALAEQSFEMTTMQPWSDTFIDLHFRAYDVTVDTESEEEMLRKVDIERFKQGLKPLTVDPELRDVARAHARDMFERGYFAHIDPDGIKPYQRVKNAGIVFGVTGENMAMAGDVSVAHEGLMQSPGHRANILRVDYRKIGVGVIDGGVYGKMFVQVFTD
ncbi:MAG TPA: CvpA family protein [Candidatus Baltobacteraceae bacterium]|nr:CvpA family protein [Candidatus Baltobacteraceae bacterium]